MSTRTATTAITALTVTFLALFVLETALASFTSPTSNDASSFTTDLLAPPTGLTATCGATISLDWTATVDTYATGHRVFRHTSSGGPYSQIAEITPRTTVTYDDAPAAGVYYYVVRAFYSGWESTDSTEVIASTGACVPPSVSGLAPSSGPEDGGTSVVISGSGFTGATAVDFGATAATGFVVDSDTQITATAPAGLGTVDVAVTTPFGTSANTVADDYAYVGTTYYVRTDGSDANTGLTNSAGGAWLTIQEAADTMVAGDTVRVQPGSYPETVTPANAGTASAPITYLADGGVVVVDGGNARCKAFDVVGTGDLVIDGFEITDQPDCGGVDAAVDINNADNVTIRNNIIHDTGRDAIYFKGTSDNGLVENNLIYNIDDDGSEPLGSGSHVYRSNTFAGTIGGWTLEGGAASNLFEDNIFWASAIQDTSLGTFNYNDYNAAVLPGTGNISSDPLFVNPAGDDYHLSHIAAGQGSDSPAIDVGSDTAANLGLDTRTTRTDAVTDTATIDLGYHYDPANVPPSVSGLAPSGGPTSGGTSVVISGSGFTGATAVDFGATAATGFVVDSDTQITATAPAGLGTVDVAVTTPFGTSANTVADDYAYVGTTYYVRTDGSDANTGLTNSAGGAWLTIQEAADTMVAGDTVRVQPGSYPETVTPANAGTASAPITYLADGGVVVVDGGNARCKAFDVVGTGDLVIDGFEITDQPDCGGDDAAVDINNADNVTIRNNIIHDTGRDAIYFKGTSDNGLVENNLIYNIDDDGSTPLGSGSHVYRSNTFAGTIGGWTLEGGAASNLFEDNIFWASAIQDTSLGTFNYNDYNAAVLPGTGNISSDPLFVNPAGDDYHLSHIAAGQGSDSPAIDVGSDTAANLGLDTRTTRTDAVTDTATIDLGYHYLP